MQSFRLLDELRNMLLITQPSQSSHLSAMFLATDSDFFQNMFSWHLYLNNINTLSKIN